MIEILERGTRKQCTCENCGAALSYEEKDVRSNATRTFNIMTFRSGCPFKHIVCPQCKHPIPVGEGAEDD